MIRSSTFSNRQVRESEKDIKNELGRLVSKITRLRTSYCVLCGDNNWSQLECGHFWHRAMPPTEFDLRNLNTLCRQCNRRHNEDREPYRKFMLEKLGQDAFDYLEAKAHSNFKMGFVELFNLREEMRLLLAEEQERAKVA